MNENSTITIEVDDDGSTWQLMPDGSRMRVYSTANWERFDAMTDEEVLANALADPDAQPLSREMIARAMRTPRPKEIRERLGLTQREFADQFHLSLGTIRDWEQGVVIPNQAAMLLLRVIDTHPAAVLDAIRQYKVPNKLTAEEEAAIAGDNVTARSAD